jgi:hypothetical protein
VTQLEFDQLSILAGSFEIEALNAIEPIAKVCRRHASELRDLLRHADTAPGSEPDGEPAALPSMRHPRPLPTIEEPTE